MAGLIMTKAVRGVLLWAPRILTILFSLYLSVFALDVFAEKSGFLQTLTALVLHLIPTFLVIVLLALAWNWEIVGVIAFAGLAIIYIAVMWGRFPWVVYAAISGPLILISVLFLLSWRQRLRARTADQLLAARAKAERLETQRVTLQPTDELYYSEGWWIRPLNGPVLGPFSTREDAEFADRANDSSPS
jgi:hypothetical protein